MASPTKGSPSANFSYFVASNEDDKKETSGPENGDEPKRLLDVSYVNLEHLEVMKKAMESDGEVEKIQASVFSGNGENNASPPILDTGFVPWLKWPAFLFGSTYCFVEIILYIIVRILVRVYENILRRTDHHNLRENLKNANTYDEWVTSAIDLDEKLGYGAWKTNPVNPYYDSELIQKVVTNLKEMREADDFRGVLAILEVCLRSNFAGIDSWKLYSFTHYGTKDLIEEYVDEVETSISYIREVPTDQGLTVEEKARFFKYVSKSLGTTVLALSGGAGMGWYHFGVLKAIMERGLTPKVVTGTSAGAIVASIYCCYNDEEVKQIVVPQFAECMNAFSGEKFTTWFPRMLKTGTRYVPDSWHENLAFCAKGDTTFKEAYERTGKVLNVSVIPADPHSPTKMLNHMTAPDCIIWSATMASAAVPGLMPPTVLLRKLPDGTVVPWELEGRHKDGSIRADIPVEALATMFNAKYTVVSQINPHIHLFLFSGAGSPGEPTIHKAGSHAWRGGFVLAALERLLKLDVMKNLRLMHDLEVFPQFLQTNWAEMLIQRFDGTVTVIPETRPKDFAKAMQDPTVEEMAHMQTQGQKSTWPKLHMIDNRLRIERQVDRGLEQFQEFLHTIRNEAPSQPQSDVMRKKRRQTWAKLGLGKDFNQVGSYVEAPVLTSEDIPGDDVVKAFVDKQEKIVRRMSGIKGEIKIAQ